MTETRIISGEGGGLSGMLRAALPTVPGVNQLPGVRKTGRELPDLVLRREGVRIDAAHVRSYADVCGFAHRDEVPLTYLHMVAFPLHMALMSDTAFPFPAIGTVHLENRISRYAHVGAGDVVDVELRAENLRQHTKGTAFDMSVAVTTGEETLWTSTSTYLRVGRGDKENGDRGTEFGEQVEGAATWRLPGNLGRQYAAVSGDSNPIHLYPLTAKAFGFPRQIAHGMWTKARAVAGFENRLPEQVEVTAGFKKPILLPGTVRFGFRQRGDEVRFAVANPRTGAPHVVGFTRSF
ncbi:MaoC family dehydratase [Nocardioides alcanivorans]|uniref:MaoC family dehydratase n=1 Tax=Nocardioides alcanivorans TaxID=2897352 RepID=UPI001F3191DB|nr:MaoC/PaaZ C-terminal domain-containing protein [Nocardioides alcanivorans]